MQSLVKKILGMMDDELVDPSGPIDTSQFNEAFMMEFVAPLAESRFRIPTASLMYRCATSEIYSADDVAFIAGTTSDQLLAAKMMTVEQIHDTLPYWTAEFEVDARICYINIGEQLMRNIVRLGASVDERHADLNKWVTKIEGKRDLTGRTIDLKNTTKPFNKLYDRLDVVSLVSEPKQRFDDKTRGIMKGVLNGNLIAAGGSVLAALTITSFNDIDLFFAGVDKHAAEKLLLKSIALMEKNFGAPPVAVYTSNCVVTVLFRKQGETAALKVQFVLRLFKDAKDIIMSFDLPPCRFMYDGENFYGMESGVYAVKNSVCIPDPLMITKAYRATKYHKKGFTYVVPNYEGLDNAFTAAAVVFSEEQLLDLGRSLAAVIAANRLHADMDPDNFPLEVDSTDDGKLLNTWFNDNVTENITENEEFIKAVRDMWLDVDPCVRMAGGDAHAFLHL